MAPQQCILILRICLLIHINPNLNFLPTIELPMDINKLPFLELHIVPILLILVMSVLASMITRRTLKVRINNDLEVLLFLKGKGCLTSPILHLAMVDRVVQEVIMALSLITLLRRALLLPIAGMDPLGTTDSDRTNSHSKQQDHRFQCKWVSNRFLSFLTSNNKCCIKVMIVTIGLN